MSEREQAADNEATSDDVRDLLASIDSKIPPKKKTSPTRGVEVRGD